MQPGDVIHGKYRLDSLLGEGGLGVVWTAWQAGLERRVAIKFLRNDPFGEQRGRFAAEAQALGQLDHPNCVGVYDFGHTDDGEPFIVMEHLSGRAVAEFRGQRVPWRDAVKIIRGVAEALVFAHDRGIVHRDLKPENVMLVEREGVEIVKVLDFGLAKLAGHQQPDITNTGELLGTPAYMSPEQLRGQSVGPATDHYSLGVMLFELLEGRLPFRGQTLLDMGMAHLSQPPPGLTRTDCPPELAALFGRLVTKDAGSRLRDARQLITVLDEIGEGPSPGADATQKPVLTLSAGQLALALGTLTIGIGLLVAVLLQREAAPVVVVRPAPRVLPASNEIVKTPDTGRAETIVAEPDMSDGSDVGSPEISGCGNDPGFTGRGNIVSDAALLTILPPKYDRNRRYPLLVLLYEKTQGTKNILRDTGFEALAAKEEFIIAVPEAEYVTAWDSPSDFENLVEGFAALKERLCIDPNRIFALGHVSGGDIAERLACDLPGFTAIATSSHRGKPDTVWCDKPIPNLYLAPLHDGYNPVEGGRSCSDTYKLSLEDHEKQWLETNGCKGARREKSKHATSTCYEWTCDTPFVSCHLDGGHNWPGAGPRKLDQLQSILKGRRCDGKPADFPYRETVWAFFEEVSAGAPR